MAAQKKRVLSGTQTSGEMHLGNYLGALQPWTGMQDEYACYFFLADLHALTVSQDPKKLKNQVVHVASTYLAAGLDPKKVVLFRQSDVSAHTELGWLLTTIATMGEMSRMTQFKDKTGKATQESIGLGLFTYPTLMAADILLYQPDLVPTGEDQKQHVELTRDLAQRFNRRFGKVFTVPEPLIGQEVARVMGLDDPTKKMSKSAASSANYIALTDSNDVIRKKISRAVTDSGTEIKSGSGKPAVTNLLTIFSQLTNTSVTKLEQRYAGKSYREFKADLTEVVVDVIAPIGTKMAELEKNPDHVRKILADGAERARPIAEATLSKAKLAIGL